jgi:hypothetical protein
MIDDDDDDIILPVNNFVLFLLAKIWYKRYIFAKLPNTEMLPCAI